MDLKIVWNWLPAIFLGIGSLQDLCRKRISILLILSFAIAGVLMEWFVRPLRIWDSLAGMSFGLLLLAVGFLTKEAIGYGDGLAVMVCGLYLGFFQNLALLFYSFFLSMLFGVCMMLAGKWNRKKEIPFFPFLLMADLLLILMEGGIGG